MDTNTKPETERVTLTCDCTVCGGRSVTAEPRVLDGRGAATSAAKHLRQISHTYVQYGYGNSPLAAALRTRYDVRPVA